MNQLKTYNQINKKDEHISFGISKMEDIYTKRKGEPDTPHRHDYFTVIVTNKAKGKHFIDFNEFNLEANQVYFVAPGQVHQIIETSKSYGYALVFSNQFLIENNIPVSFIDDLNLFNDFGSSPPLFLNKDIHQKINLYLTEIYNQYNSQFTYKNEAIGALLKLILIACNNACSLPSDYYQSIDSTLRKFKTLINQHYKEWHATTDYANQLNISPDHLNRLVKTQTGKTAKEHIQSRIIVAAKRLIYFTDLSNKEIGFELGFSEPANFSAFFKHQVGISPSKFKENH
ncbi:helix-turn-helix transcriptional regulator [Wenyingzhuangia sp. chi5]|uniref:Helix-turn-helix transcriptional regulator n=1 Tax=Wenyingzhuangia gilva TaxID=3057677 RepID=A0ABT8VMQ0_9FLAO|nr:helix-turn-helix transcriptional regulator [Wenyingzhuangia sp. chi5]MDO3693250.1 helix-turn-helix transcriptional regulator [Wenyingzhuangia sp. chi5]